MKAYREAAEVYLHSIVALALDRCEFMIYKTINSAH